MKKATHQNPDIAFEDIRTAHKALWRSWSYLEQVNIVDAGSRGAWFFRLTLDFLYVVEAYLVERIYSGEGNPQAQNEEHLFSAPRGDLDAWVRDHLGPEK